MQFKSRRNRVELVEIEGRNIIKKTFINCDLCQKEVSILNQLFLYNLSPRIIAYTDTTIYMEYIYGTLLLEYLDLQEIEGFQKEIWDKLGNYLEDCKEKIGLLPSDCNLRNFIYNNEIVGIDFEEYEDISLQECITKLVAMIMLYDPIKSHVKKQIQEYYIDRYHVSLDAISIEMDKIIQRRINRKKI